MDIGPVDELGKFQKPFALALFDPRDDKERLGKAEGIVPNNINVGLELNSKLHRSSNRIRY